MYLPEGPVRPTEPALDAFWEQASAALPKGVLADTYQVRWIGVDAPGTQEIFDLITARDKTGSCRAAGAQLAPPSAETSTLAILPVPDQAKPEIS